MVPVPPGGTGFLSYLGTVQPQLADCRGDHQVSIYGVRVCEDASHLFSGLYLAENHAQRP